MGKLCSVSDKYVLPRTAAEYPGSGTHDGRDLYCPYGAGDLVRLCQESSRKDVRVTLLYPVSMNRVFKQGFSCNVWCCMLDFVFT